MTGILGCSSGDDLRRPHINSSIEEVHLEPLNKSMEITHTKVQKETAKQPKLFLGFWFNVYQVKLEYLEHLKNHICFSSSL